MKIKFHFKKQVKYLLAVLLFSNCFVLAKAQNDEWFKGSWYGAKSFSHAHIGAKVLVRIEIDSLYKNQFSGRFIYMYPKDTIARLVRTFNGNINGKFISINKSDELYLLDPRSRSFWSNCTQCDESGSFLLSDGNLVFTIITTGCGDSCDAETVFSRSMDTYDNVAKVDIQKMFDQNEAPGIIASNSSKQKIKDEKPGKKILIDSISKNTKSKTDSLAVIANINSKEKNSKISIAKQSPVDSVNNNQNAI
ncbi:MAG: hypothetical protein ABJB05_14730, partial [Parafilimonas sp.]